MRQQLHGIQSIRDSRHKSCTKGGRFLTVWQTHRCLQHTALKSHQILIFRRSAIHTQSSYRHSIFCFHHFHHICDLVCDGFQCRLYDFPFSCGTAHTKKDCFCLRFPIRCTKARKRWNQIRLILGICRFGQLLCLSRRSNQTDFFLQPGNDCSGIVNISFQHIGYFTMQSPGQ